MNKLRGMHFGSYWMKENDIVFLMEKDLGKVCNLKGIDTHIYDSTEKYWYKEDKRFNPVNPVRWLEHEKVMAAVDDFNPDFVVVNAGGMSLMPETTDILRKNNVVTIGISLSDPDVFPYHGKIYSHLYDFYYTNSVHSLKNDYSKKTSINLMPFAASTSLHRPMPEVKKEYDIVVVGHARPDRIELVKKLQKYFKVGLFGYEWGRNYYPVNGMQHVKAINSGKMYLSFSKTVAGFTNVKVGIFEAAACRTFLISEYFEEMNNYFKYDREIAGYTNDDQLIELIDFYLKNEEKREWITENSYQKLLREHTYEIRWKNILKSIYEKDTKIGKESF